MSPLAAKHGTIFSVTISSSGPWVSDKTAHSELCVIKCTESSREYHPGEFLSPYILRRSGHSGQCARRSEPRRIATWPDNAIFTLFWEGYFISWQTGLPVDIEMFYLYELLWCPSEDSLSVLLCNHSLDMEMCHPYELNLCVSEDCFSLFIFHSIDIVMFAFHCCL